MSQLIRMRQRIKAIKTIKKITHALRLISMSTHLRLRSKKNAIEEYKIILSDLFSRLSRAVPQWSHPLMSTSENKSNNSLVILVGSQKGLCGNFNTELYAFFEKEMAQQNRQQLSLITVGKKTHDYARLGLSTIIKSFDEFSLSTIEQTSRSITDYLLRTPEPYSSVIVYSNKPKSFFVQKPYSSKLIPFVFEQNPGDQEADMHDDYVWEQDPSDIMNSLVEKLVYMTIYELLFQSLISEQAARFIAMDNSTRSASKLLDSMQLLYNKMRQSKITGELTDLIGGFF